LPKPSSLPGKRITLVPLPIFEKGWNFVGDVLDCTVPTTESLAFDEQVSLSPNPAKDIIKITGLLHEIEVVILDALGKVLRERAPFEAELDVSLLPSGVYFIQIFSEGRQTTKRLIKE
jgi:hypothetical protein